MTITNFTPVPALIGGMLIGLSALIVLRMNGKVAGISGIVGRLFQRVPGDTAWRVWFLVGLIGGGAAVFAGVPRFAAFQLEAGTGTLLVAGFLVGLGTRVGGGCTSGHGVCGTSRGSLRSIVATLTFMATGFATVYVTHHLLSGGAAS